MSPEDVIAATWCALALLGACIFVATCIKALASLSDGER